MIHFLSMGGSLLLWLSVLSRQTVYAFQVVPPFHSVILRSDSSQQARPQATTSLGMAKDWDAILKQAEEEDEEQDSAISDSLHQQQSSPQLFIPPDMQYNQRNCMRQNRHYQQIREIADPDLIHDIYIRDPQDSSQVYWFLGKAARVSDVSVQDCVNRQWNLMETHAVNLRPMDLFKAKGELELWIAQGDSELEVAYNRPDVRLIKIDKSTDPAIHDAIPNIMVGFQGEIYDANEPGFRTWRLPDGSPARPEITGPQEEQIKQAAEKLKQPDKEDEYRPPTDEEMEQLKEALKEKDIAELWREQQLREGKDIDDDDDD